MGLYLHVSVRDSLSLGAYGPKRTWSGAVYTRCQKCQPGEALSGGNPNVSYAQSGTCGILAIELPHICFTIGRLSAIACVELTISLLEDVKR